MAEAPYLSTKHITCTQSTNGIGPLVTFDQSSVQSLANADYDAALTDSLQALSILDAPQLSVLDTCAAAYASKGLFGKAMEIAEKMMECAPTSAAGYLRTGKTLALQGKHEHAIKVYKQGQEKVPVDDEQYASLEEHRAASKIQTDKRLDFLTLLPIDVTDIIIGILTDDDEVDFDLICMDVSMAWRRIIADYPLAWSSFGISRSETDKAFFALLPVVGRHVKSLWLEDMDTDQSQKIVEAIVNGQLNNLQKLEVINCNVDSETLLNVLYRLANTLTKLILVIGEGYQAPLLGSILVTCPSLELLSYQINEGSLVFGEELLVPSKCNIKTLMLNADSLTNDTADAILRRCPNLQGLRIGECTGDGLKLVIDHCPHLKLLGFNGPVPVQPEISVDDLPGMQQIALRYTEEIVPEHVIMLLRKYQRTLQNVTLTIYDEGPNVSERWAGLKDIKGENLKHLTYSHDFSMDMHTIIATVIRNCQALESVMFQALSETSGSTLDDALLSLPNLRVLTLSRMPDDCLTSLKLFFDGQVDKGETSSLCKITLHKCDEIPDSILEAISAIKTIEEISIVECSEATEWLVNFIDQLSAHNTLKSMCLENMDTITDDVLCSLTKLFSLRELALTSLAEITNDAVERLIDDMKSLEAIEISCPQIDRHVRKRIQKKLNERKRK